MNKTKNIMIAGVGGQGTLLASRLLGNLLVTAGYDVKISEVHGMSQRGGSVVTFVRFGDTVHSPVIDKGQADILLSFELLEAARYLPYLVPGGRVIVNTDQIDPIPVITGAATYPQGLEETLAEQNIALETLDALSLAQEAGTSRAVNVVLMGQLARSLDFTKEQWEDAIRATVPPRFIDLNLKAFSLAYDQPATQH